jgi:hypothetical protein
MRLKVKGGKKKRQWLVPVKGDGEGIRKGGRRVNMMEILCTHV